MSSYSEGGFHGKGGIPIKGNPRRDSEIVGRPSSLVGSHDDRCPVAFLHHSTKIDSLVRHSFNPTDELKRLELQEAVCFGARQRLHPRLGGAGAKKGEQGELREHGGPGQV